MLCLQGLVLRILLSRNTWGQCRSRERDLLTPALIPKNQVSDSFVFSRVIAGYYAFGGHKKLCSRKYYASVGEYFASRLVPHFYPVRACAKGLRNRFCPPISPSVSQSVCLSVCPVKNFEISILICSDDMAI